MVENRLDRFCEAVIDFLEASNVTYLVVGGVAVSIIGEPRMTQDIDLIVSLKKQEIRPFLESALAHEFEINIEKELQQIKQTGTFRLGLGAFHADIIIASTPFEESAFVRVQRIKFMDKIASFPSPEDLILFKIIVGRDKDMLDAKSIAIRHKHRLDRKYLEKWTQTISDEAEDMSIWNRLMKVLENA